MKLAKAGQSWPWQGPSRPCVKDNVNLAMARFSAHRQCPNRQTARQLRLPLVSLNLALWLFAMLPEVEAAQVPGCNVFDDNSRSQSGTDKPFWKARALAHPVAE